MRGLFRALLLVAGIGLADSLNPSTVGPGVYLAIAPAGLRRLLAFTAGVFTAYTVGGVLLLLGPGQLVLDALPHPTRHFKHILSVAGGLVLVAVAVVMWLARHRLANRQPPGLKGGGGAGSTFAAGFMLMVAELPTAFPLFAAAAAILSSGASLAVQIAMLSLFNVLFVAPLIAMAIVLATMPGARGAILQPAADWLAKHWPIVFAALAFLVGVVLAAWGAKGLVHS